VSIKALEQRQQTIEQGLAQIKNKEQADIEGMANAFLSSSDPIGFIGRLASEAPTKIAPVVNAARRKKNESMQAQVPQQETVTTAGMREVFELSRPQQQQQQQQQRQQPDPRQTAIAGLPMNPNMFRGAGGGIVAFAGPEGSFVRDQRLLEAEKRRARDAASFSNFLTGRYNYPGMAGVTKALEAQNQTVGSEPNSFVGASAELKAEPYYDEKTGKVIYPEGYTDIKEGTYSERSDVRDYLTEGERQDFLPQEGKEPTVDQERKTAEYFAKQRADEEIPRINPTDEDLLGRPKSEVEGFGDVVVDMADKTQAILDEFAIEKPEDFNPDDYTVKKTRKRFTDAGINLNLLSDQANKLGEEKLKLGKDKKEALAFFGLEAGLNILAGKDPNALVNIGAGAGKAIAPLRKELTRLKDSHNALRKEENQLARMQSQQDMGIAKFSQESLNAARKSYDANRRNYDTIRAQTANRILADNSALERVKMQVKGQKESAEMQAIAAGAKASAIEKRAMQKLQSQVVDRIVGYDQEYGKLIRKGATEKEKLDFINKKLAAQRLPLLVGERPPDPLSLGL
jgi:hypothetical protein